MNSPLSPPTPTRPTFASSNGPTGSPTREPGHATGQTLRTRSRKRSTRYMSITRHTERCVPTGCDPVGWSKTVIRNYVTDRFRRSKTQRRRLHALALPATDGADVADEVTDQIIARKALSFVASLKDRDHMIAVMRYIDGLQPRDGGTAWHEPPHGAHLAAPHGEEDAHAARCRRAPQGLQGGDDMIEILFIVLTALLVIMACFTGAIRWARRVRQSPADADAVRELYDRYVADVEALTQAYLLQGPRDHDWLARKRETDGVPHQPPRAVQDPQRQAGGQARHARPRGSAARGNLQGRRAADPFSRPARGALRNPGRPRGLLSLDVVLVVAACSLGLALLAHSVSGQGNIGWLAPTSMAVISAVAVIRASTGKLGNWGIEDGRPEEEGHRRIGKRRQSAAITPGHADTHPDGDD
jgi:hypothetical protein